MANPVHHPGISIRAVRNIRTREASAEITRLRQLCCIVSSSHRDLIQSADSCNCRRVSV